MKTVVAAAIGDCVHVAGLHAALKLAKRSGYRGVMLGPAVPTERIIEAIRRENPEIVALSYRLTPEAGENVLRELVTRVREEGLENRRYCFGGTPPVAEKALQFELFDGVFDGSEGPTAVEAYFSGKPLPARAETYPDTLVERIAASWPKPLIRHHYGQPTFEATLEGVVRLAQEKVLDVISLGVDQNTQEHFFHPDEMDPAQDGAGGVPIRTPDQFRALYEHTRLGNYPLMRSYAGTRDLLKMAQLLHETIRLAWAAIPLTWYSVLDGRSDRPLSKTIAEAQDVMRWCATQNIPVEMNESHHWSLRDAHDTIAVVAAYLAAYNAKRCGVPHYVQQLMFNNPPDTSFRMDLAKMLAKLELVEGLQDDGFQVFRETRTGLRSHLPDQTVSKGHLASSVMLQMAVQPHIVHVVAHCEADHAARDEDIMESVKIAQGAIQNALRGQPDMTLDPIVQTRKEELLEEARVLLDAITELAPPGVSDPWFDPQTLTRAATVGLLDTPHFRGNPAVEAYGQLVTACIDGACRAVDPESGRVLSERERVRQVLDKALRKVS